MKRFKVILSISLFSILSNIRAQNIGINPTGSSPHTSAGLDVDFTNRGFLPPRIADTNAITIPAEGLMIYDLSSHCMRYRKSANWSNCMGVNNTPSGAITNLNCNGFLQTGTLCVGTLASGVAFSIPYSGANYGSFSAQVINSTGVTGLFANLPSGTYNSSGNGSLVFTLNGTPATSGTASFILSIDGQTCLLNLNVLPLPGAFTVSNETFIGSNGFTANWSTSTNALGYYLDIALDNSFTNFLSGYNNLSVGNTNSYNVSGLTPGTNYFYRVRSQNNCGTSVNSSSVSLTTLVGCNPYQTEASYATVSSVPGATSLIWITKNLGATSQATMVTDDNIGPAGCYYQFGEAQPYAINGTTNGTTSNPSWTTVAPPAGNWLLSNDPCRISLGGNWRLPTNTELTNVDASGSWTNGTFAFSSLLKLHYAGHLSQSTGSLTGRGSAGWFWSSNQTNSISGNFLFIGNSDSNVYNNADKGLGYTVRCVH